MKSQSLHSQRPYCNSVETSSTVGLLDKTVPAKSHMTSLNSRHSLMRGPMSLQRIDNPTRL